MAPLKIIGALALATAAVAAPADGYYYPKPSTTTARTSARPSTTTCVSSARPSTTTSVNKSSASTTTGATTSTITSAPPGTTTSSSSNTQQTTTLLATGRSKDYGLNDAAKKAGKLWFGTAVDYPGTGERTDQYYLEALNNVHDFGEMTPANIMKFVNTEPEQNVFTFDGAEQFLALAKQTNKQVRCHNLIWQSQLPEWVTNPSTPWTNETLSAVLSNHVQKLVGYFGDRCAEWDVVNEAFSDNPAGSFAPNIWYNTIGPNYVAQAFAAAQEIIKRDGLTVKLFYNDYNIESPGAKSTAAQNLVKDLKARGIQIDGVGLESHFIVGSTPSQAAQEANMRAFGALGVRVVVTELDVRTVMPPSLETQQQQIRDYQATVAACKNVEACDGVVVWDFVDTYSWIPSTFAGQGYGDIFLQPNGENTPLLAKAAYDGALYGWSA